MVRRSITIVLITVALAAATLLLVPTFLGIGTPSGNEIVYVVLKTTEPQMEFWQTVRAGIQAAATEYDLRPIIVGPRKETDVDRQIEILQEVISVDPDAILLAASDFTRLVPLAEDANERGIIVVTLDSALDSDAPVSFVATDNVAAGHKAGQEIDRLVPAGDEIAVISHIPGVATAIDRERGAYAALSHDGKNRIIDTFHSENDPDIAYRLVTELAHNEERFGGIVALNENSTVGAGRAIRDLGLSDEIFLVGFDNSKEEIEFLETGVVDALVVQRPFNMGYLGIRTIARTLRGDKVEPVIYTDAVLVRKDDMYTEENQKLLFPIVQARPTYENDYSVDDSPLSE